MSNLSLSRIEELLGQDSNNLLGHVSKTVDKSQLHLPGPDFMERVWLHSNRSPQVIRSLGQIYNSGRLAGTGYTSILPIDQGIEHSDVAYFAKNPI